VSLPALVPSDTVRYCGRTFTATELGVLRELAATLPTRRAIADAACDALGWTRPDGRRKDMSAQVALLRMADDALITLPPPRTGNRQPALAAAPGRRRRTLPRPRRTRPAETAAHPAGQHDRRVQDLEHPGRDPPLPGLQPTTRRAAALPHRVRHHGILALAGFGASAWKCAARDTHLGWDLATREANLHLVVGNARFLILPHVRVPHLASHVFARLTRQLSADWQRAYNYRPVVETFVERDRFAGTSYRAANWIHVGQTT
jgi:Domain of unknown function (DUF4338)